LSVWAVALFLSGLVFCPARATEPAIASVTEPVPAGHQARDLSGTLSTFESLTLRVNTDLGSVRVVPLERGAAPVVRYSVRVETDARGPGGAQLLERYTLSAKNTPAGVEITGNLPQQSGHAQFWVHFEIAVPMSYSLDISTGAGDILTGEIGGIAKLSTEGGNIIAGRIGAKVNVVAAKIKNKTATRPLVKLITQGGHIQVEDVAGDLTAFTAGGHINTGYIQGDADLQSGGGHIRATGIGGKASLATEGGNITVGKAGSFVAVKTGGGQIDFGEVRGSVHAQTGGGGIRVMYVSGPMDVESNGGSICLTRVSGAVRAATNSGSITAWINPDITERGKPSVRLTGASQLTSGDGDIVVFLPRNLAANIEAVVESGGPHRIQADPALALQVAKNPAAAGSIKAVASLNGGGPLLRLKTTAGRIKLQYSDSETALWAAMMRDQEARMQRDLAMTNVSAGDLPWAPMPPMPALAAPAAAVAPHAQATPQGWATPETAVAPPAPEAWNGTWVEKLEIRILGGLRLDSDTFQQRITQAPAPPYPEIARKAGVEGTVRLQVRLTQDGRVEVQKLLEGDTVLADAAIAALKEWRGTPMTIDGKPVDVISTVTFRFKLR